MAGTTTTKVLPPRPVAFYYEDYDTSSDVEYLYYKQDADRYIRALEERLDALTVRY